MSLLICILDFRHISYFTTSNNLVGASAIRGQKYVDAGLLGYFISKSFNLLMEQPALCWEDFPPDVVRAAGICSSSLTRELARCNTNAPVAEWEH